MKASQRVLAADIGSSAIKLVKFEIDNAGALVLSHYVIKEIPFSSHSSRFLALTETFKSAAEEMGIAAASIALAVSDAFILAIKLPPMPQNKLDKIVTFEARQNAPFPLEEAVWDYQIFSQNTEASAVMAVAQKNLMEEICAACACVSWHPEFVDASPLALARTMEETNSDSLIIDMGASATRLVILGKNRIFYRSIPLGGKLISESISKELVVDLETAETWKKTGVSLATEDSGSSKEARANKTTRMIFARLYLEINRALDFYKAQHEGAVPSALLLAGGASLLSYADTFLSEKLSLPVKRIDITQSVALSSNLDAAHVKHDAPLLAPLVGLAQRSSQRRDDGINLLPLSISSGKEKRMKRFCLAGALAVWTLAFIIPALASFWQWKQTARATEQKKIRLAEMTLFFQQAKVLEKEFQEKKAFLSAYEQVARARAFWPALLDDLNERTPPDVWLTFLDAEDKALLNLRGLAEAKGDALNKIGDFRNSLDASPFFKEVKNVRSELPLPSTTPVALHFTFQASLKEDREPLP